MSDLWRVHPGGLIHYENALLYEKAKHRVLHSRRLRDYYEIILGDGVADNADHLHWAATAPADDVAAWAKRSARENEPRNGSLQGCGSVRYRTSRRNRPNNRPDRMRKRIKSDAFRIRFG